MFLRARRRSLGKRVGLAVRSIALAPAPRVHVIFPRARLDGSNQLLESYLGHMFKSGDSASRVECTLRGENGFHRLKFRYMRCDSSRYSTNDFCTRPVCSYGMDHQRCLQEQAETYATPGKCRLMTLLFLIPSNHHSSPYE